MKAALEILAIVAKSYEELRRELRRRKWQRDRELVEKSPLGWIHKHFNGGLRNDKPKADTANEADDNNGKKD